jgi:hypothetical protein
VSIIAIPPAGVQQSAFHVHADAPAELVDVDPVDDESRRWWAWASLELDGPTDEDYDAMFDAWGEGEGRAFPDDYAGLADADMLPGGIG